MLRTIPFILGFFLILNSLTAATVAGVDLSTLTRPSDLDLSPAEIAVEKKEQARIRKALKLIESGEYDAKTEDSYSKLDKKNIDRSATREAGRKKIAEGTDMLNKGSENILALYEKVRKRNEMLIEAESTGLLRAWTNLDGRSIQALFVDLIGDQLTIQAPTGEEYIVPLSKLIKSDGAAAKLMKSGKKLNAEDFLASVKNSGASEIERFYAANFEPDTSTQGDALTIAIKRSRILSPMLKKLIDMGISPNTHNSEGLLPLSVCAQEGAQQAAEFLIKSGASPTEVDATTEELTPLLWAIHLGEPMMTVIFGENSEDLSQNLESLVQLAEDDQLKPVSKEMIAQLLTIDNGSSISFKDEINFRLKLFGLEPTMAALEKAIITRSFRPHVVNYHAYDFYVHTLERNNEYVDDVINEWKEQKNLGDVGATYSMAIALLNGWVGYKDSEIAIQYLQEAAKLDHPPSMILLGEIYEEGRYIEANPQEAFNNYRKSAEIGDPIGMVKLGHCYEKGIHVEKNNNKAFSWYERATEAGSTEGMAQLGRCYMEGISIRSDSRKGIEWYTKAAEANNLSAMNYLGEALIAGKGGRGSTNTGVEWLQRAADFGDPSALLKLGFAYSDGTLRVDEQLASKYFLEAAERDNLEAMYQIGRRIGSGTGIQKNSEQAFSWYQAAADRDHLEALNQVAVSYSSGTGVAQNQSKAFKLFKQVAAKGHMEATANLAICYAKGLGTSVDEQESSRLYLEVVNSGNANAIAIVQVLTKEEEG